MPANGSAPDRRSAVSTERLRPVALVLRKPPVIRPRWVRLESGQPSRRNNVRGNHFQDRVLRRLQDEYGRQLKTNVVFRFEALHGPGQLFPDAILELPRKTVVIEVKLRSNVYLWYQLMNLYAPLARHVWPDRPVCCLGIVEQLRLPIEGVPSQPYLAEKPHNATSAGYWICEHRA